MLPKNTGAICLIKVSDLNKPPSFIIRYIKASWAKAFASGLFDRLKALKESINLST